MALTTSSSHSSTDLHSSDLEEKTLVFCHDTDYEVHNFSDSSIKCYTVIQWSQTINCCNKELATFQYNSDAEFSLFVWGHFKVWNHVCIQMYTYILWDPSLIDWVCAIKPVLTVPHRFFFPGETRHTDIWIHDMPKKILESFEKSKEKILKTKFLPILFF